MPVSIFVRIPYVIPNTFKTYDPAYEAFNLTKRTQRINYSC